MKASLTLSDRKRAAIIDAAIECFIVYGFDHASMDKIAEQADVSKRTVYNHFPSKELLFEEIVHRLKEKAGAEAKLVYLIDAPLLPQLFAFCRRVADFHCSADSRKLVRILVSRFLQSPELAQALFGNAKIFEKELCQWIRRAQRDRRVTPCNVTFVAKQVLALIETFVIWPPLIKNTPVPNRGQRDRIAAGAAELFLAKHATCDTRHAVLGRKREPRRKVRTTR